MKKDMLTRFLPAFTQKKKNLLTKVYHLLFNSSTIRILFQTTSHTIMKTCLCWNSRILNNICQKTLVFHAPTHNSRTTEKLPLFKVIHVALSSTSLLTNLSCNLYKKASTPSNSQSCKCPMKH